MAPDAAARMNVQAKVVCLASTSVGSAPEVPLLAAELAAREALQRAGLQDVNGLQFIELHDAFAVQGLSFAKGLGLSPDQLNVHGGGLARGHPIGASAAVALVRLLSDLTALDTLHAKGLVAVAGAGGDSKGQRIAGGSARCAGRAGGVET